MKKLDKYVGLDVHKDTTVIAVAEEGRAGEVRLYGTISSDLHALEKALRRIGGEGVTLHVVYEAGPTGYVLYRRLQQLGIACIVVAPSKVPHAPGVRQKTDRRDAEQLARLHRAGDLTAIHVPDAVDESIRDLTRARADAVHDLTRAKQRLKSFLLRQGLKRRLAQHEAGDSQATACRRPWHLIYYEAYRLRQDAEGRERFLKSGAGRRYLAKQCATWFKLHPPRSA